MLKKIAKYTCTFAVALNIVCSSYLLFANDHTVIKDLKESWYSYDNVSQTYVPFVANLETEFNYIGFFVPESLYKGKKLLLSVPPRTSLLLNNKLISYYTNASEIAIEMDSLYAISSSDPFFVLYGPSLDLKYLSTRIISNDVGHALLKSGTNDMYFDLLQRNFNALNDFYVAAILILLIFLGILFRSFKKFYKDYFGISRILTFRVREEGIYKLNALSGINLFFLLFLSLTISYLMISFFSIGSLKSFGILDWSDVRSAFVSWFILAGIILMFFILKYVYIHIISSVLLINDFRKVHYFDSIRVTSLFFNGLLILFVFYYFNFKSFLDFDFNRVIFYFIVMFLVFHTMFIFFKLLSLHPFRKLHLFSYLCTTELIPMIIGLKFFVNN